MTECRLCHPMTHCQCLFRKDANHRFSFRKLQIFISQTTDFHFVSFHFVSFGFVSQSTISQPYVVLFCLLLSEADLNLIYLWLIKSLQHLVEINSYNLFSNSLIIHEEKTKEITTVKEVWICDPNSVNFCFDFLQELSMP